MNYSFLCLLVLILSGCIEAENHKNSEYPQINQTEFAVMGDSIALLAQKTLVQQVMAAIQEGGTAHAVEFCNTHAIPLTDSLSLLSKVRIQRISEKNRNTGNGIVTSSDSMAMRLVQSRLATGNEPEPAIFNVAGSTDIVYYKPIKIGMPACLSCHGDTKKDISAETLKIINAKYPEDKAIDYKEGDFRGLWKISFSKAD